jgi:hypothetical protein
MANHHHQHQRFYYTFPSTRTSEKEDDHSPKLEEVGGKGESYLKHEFYIDRRYTDSNLHLFSLIVSFISLQRSVVN